MGLIQKEIEELREIIKNQQWQGRKLNHDELMDAIGTYSQVEKREKSIISALALAAKYKNDGIPRKIVATNLLGNYEAIAVEANPEHDHSVVCPEQDHKTITRADCLDYSGSHLDDCAACEQKKITQQLLIDGHRPEEDGETD